MDRTVVVAATATLRPLDLVALGTAPGSAAAPRRKATLSPFLTLLGRLPERLQLVD
jgi:hypothetical protein